MYLSRIFVCSTPYGIRGLGTSCAIANVTTDLVCSTPYGIRGLGTRIGTKLNLAFLQCSTPYGIRGLGTVILWRPLTKLRVLNALRHQRFGHLEIRPSGRVIVSVLNALRHQRFGHHSGFVRYAAQTGAQRLTASEVWAHGEVFVLSGWLLVLNALRHQRFGHGA